MITIITTEKLLKNLGILNKTKDDKTTSKTEDNGESLVRLDEISPRLKLKKLDENSGVSGKILIMQQGYQSHHRKSDSCDRS